jgi:hypothetical protein
LFELCELIVDRGLRTKQRNPNGSVQRAQCGFAKAALRATQALADLRSRRLPLDFVEDVPTIWRYTERYQGLQAGIEKLGQEQEQRWYELEEQDRFAPVIVLRPEEAELQGQGSAVGEVLAA